jgi:hypothetical protein
MREDFFAPNFPRSSLYPAHMSDTSVFLQRTFDWANSFSSTHNASNDFAADRKAWRSETHRPLSSTSVRQTVLGKQVCTTLSYPQSHHTNIASTHKETTTLPLTPRPQDLDYAAAKLASGVNTPRCRLTTLTEVAGLMVVNSSQSYDSYVPDGKGDYYPSTDTYCGHTHESGIPGGHAPIAFASDALDMPGCMGKCSDMQVIFRT